MTLEKGRRFILDAACELGDAERVGLDYKELPQDVEPGALLLLDDGKIVLEVTDVRGDEVRTLVRQGGVLSNNKGINRQGGGLTAPALTAKDLADLAVGLEVGVDFVALSFVREARDILQLKAALDREGPGPRPLVIAKIEDQQAVANLQRVIREHATSDEANLARQRLRELGESR